MCEGVASNVVDKHSSRVTFLVNQSWMKDLRWVQGPLALHGDVVITFQAVVGAAVCLHLFPGYEAGIPVLALNFMDN
jgi:hypothetical protein